MLLPAHAHLSLHSHGVWHREGGVHIAVLHGLQRQGEALRPDGVLDGDHRLQLLVLHLHQPSSMLSLLNGGCDNQADGLASGGDLVPPEELLVGEDGPDGVVLLAQVRGREDPRNARRCLRSRDVDRQQLGVWLLAENEGRVQRAGRRREVVHVLGLARALRQRVVVGHGLANGRPLVLALHGRVVRAAGRGGVLQAPAGHVVALAAVRDRPVLREEGLRR
mmetsp:Transcript_15711/g.45070  ORF Transcript_15711/g.45070 Transcript_15711/m.45070 type:complete len:221 (-) Transcript_15711:214-876(-)